MPGRALSHSETDLRASCWWGVNWVIARTPIEQVAHPAKNKKRTLDGLYSFRLEGWANAVMMHSGGQERARPDSGAVDGAHGGRVDAKPRTTKQSCVSLIALCGAACLTSRPFRA